MADAFINDPSNPNNPGPYIVDSQSGNTERFEPGIDDLTEPLRQRLGDYLSRNTVHGHDNGYEATRGNSYTVTPGSSEFTFSRDGGGPIDLVTAGGMTDPENVFAPASGHLATEFADGNTFAGEEVGGRTLGELLSKGGVNQTAPYTGNTLLKDGVHSTALDMYGKVTADPVPDPENTPVSQLVSQALFNNRWNPRAGSTPFDPEGARASDTYTGVAGATVSMTMPIATLQSEMGVYNPKNGDEDQITFDQLRRVGLSLMLQAAGEPPPGNGILDPLSAAAFATLAPGAAQLGIPRPQVQVTDANNAHGAPGAPGGAVGIRPHVRAGAQAGSSAKDDPVGFPFTYGSFNHFLEPFQKDVVASRTLAAVLVLALSLAIKPVEGILTALISPVAINEAGARVSPIGAIAAASTDGAVVGGIAISDPVVRADKAGLGPLLHMGRSSRRNLVFTPAVWEFLGFVVPDNQGGTIATPNNSRQQGGDPFTGKLAEYFTTSVRGTAVLFGIANVAMSPGYYITIAREIIRDIVMAARRMIQRIEGGVTGGVSPSINSISETIMDMIDTKAVRFVNVLVTIGNASLKAAPAATLGQIIAGGFNPGAIIRGADGATNATSADNVALSAQGALPARYSLAPKVVGAEGRGSGYRAGNAISSFLMPASFLAAANTTNDALSTAWAVLNQRREALIGDAQAELGEQDPIAMLTMLQVGLLYPGAKLRSPGKAYDELRDREGGGDDSNFKVYDDTIDIAQRDAIEAELDAEYMPFYFHDLRTNEIVGLQAFLENLTDNYSVSHSSTSAYGRIDDIMIYQKTKRAISIGFTIACTNPVDFQIMYAKINKLTTMIYPQWSSGRQAIGDNTQITIPFSQIPTASPVIRLRIGDIIRTNGSRFNLLRLFGVGNENFTMDGYDAGSSGSDDPDTPPVEVPSGETDFSKFINNETNPVLRSFNAVGGQGLAGVITSMNFNWMGGGTWEVARFSSRAPKLCKVTISFSPIHDIAPGIDAAGMNRAPLYPVGDAMASIAGQTGLGTDSGRAKFLEEKEKVDDVLNKMISKSSLKDNL